MPLSTARGPFLALSIVASMLLAACGGGSSEDEGDDGGGGGVGFAPTCDTSSYAAGAVELPTSAQIAAYAGSFAGDEGQYDANFNFVKSGSATLAVANDGRLTYRGTAYDPRSVCIDKIAGPYGRILYFLVGTQGHFDVADKVDVVLGQAWGVSPVDGATIFTNGRK